MPQHAHPIEASTNGLPSMVSTTAECNQQQATASTASSGLSRAQLNDRERSRLEELFLASRALVEPVEHEKDVRFFQPKYYEIVIQRVDFLLLRFFFVRTKIVWLGASGD